MTAISLAISSCPNDTFIFEELVHRPPPSLSFSLSLHDIEELNQGALRGLWDMTKVSCAVVPLLEANYVMLSCGGAMGKGVGPLLVARTEDFALQPKMKIAVPGMHTTAFKLFKFAFSSVSQLDICAMHFAEIEDAVQSGVVDAGVLIHEGRFTYQKKQLYLVADLGKAWEHRMNLPVPLGVIMMKKSLYAVCGSEVEEGIRSSIRCAWNAYPRLNDFVRRHAQEMEEEVMRSHISLYVNDWSMEMGEKECSAIQMLGAL